MADALSLDLVDKDLLTDAISLTIGYDVENISDPNRRGRYKGEIVKDGYGRLIPKPAHSSCNLGDHTNSSDVIIRTMLGLYDRIVGKDMLVRRITIVANNVLKSSVLADKAKGNSKSVEQISLFDIREERTKEYSSKEDSSKEDISNDEESIAKAMLKIKKKYGKNAILKGTSYQEGATARERNSEIGGHKA